MAGATFTLEELFDNSLQKERKLLDLSKIKIDNYDDYVKYLDRVPELKMVPEQVDLEELSSTTTNNLSSFIPTRKERLELDITKNGSRVGCGVEYEDPMPLSMRELRLDDIYSVDIHWKMLTDLRPVNRKEEDYVNRIIDLGKFKRDTRVQEAAVVNAMMTSVPGSSVQVKALAMGFITSKSKRGTLETRLKSCKECGLELCTGVFCKLQHYERYARVILDKDELEAEDAKGFSLKSVIDQANSKPDAKAAERKVRERREAKKGPSLKAMLTKAKSRKRKKKKKKGDED